MQSKESWRKRFKMLTRGYLTVSRNGRIRFSKGHPNLNWNEITIAIQLDVPNKLFERPMIQAQIKVDESIIPKEQPVQLILNTKELIEESTGAKIEFSVVPYENKSE